MGLLGLTLRELSATPPSDGSGVRSGGLVSRVEALVGGDSDLPRISSSFGGAPMGTDMQLCGVGMRVGPTTSKGSNSMMKTKLEL